MEKAEAFRQRVTSWYRKHGDADLPWRKSRDRWHVLIAAVLLRKTTVKQVLKIYQNFIQKFPSPHAVLDSSVEEIREIIRPLGIENQRARLIREAAKYIVENLNGEIPCDKDALKNIPGVGDYAAAEVLLVACGKLEPLLDRNVIRLLSRVFGVTSSKKRPHLDPAMWSFAREVLTGHDEAPLIYNFGALDLARKICRPKNPRCRECPLADICAHYQASRQRLEKTR